MVPKVSQENNTGAPLCGLGVHTSSCVTPSKSVEMTMLLSGLALSAATGGDTDPVNTPCANIACIGRCAGFGVPNCSFVRPCMSEPTVMMLASEVGENDDVPAAFPSQE